MTISKIKLKFDNVEIEYEGEQQHLMNDLGALLAQIENFSQHLVDQQVTTTSREPQSVEEKTSFDQSQTTRTFTVGTLATKLNVNSAADLVICAMGHLHFILGKEKSDRKTIMTSMKSATNHNKPAMTGGNLSKAFSSLIKNGKIIETTKNTYALTAKELKNLETIIDQLG